jgi:hypothetical protein
VQSESSIPFVDPPGYALIILDAVRWYPRFQCLPHDVLRCCVRQRVLQDDAELGAAWVRAVTPARSHTNNLVRAYLDARRWADAEAEAHRCLEARIRKTPDDWLRFHTTSQLDAALAG